MTRWRRSTQSADVASCRCGNARAVAVLYRSMHNESDRAAARWTDYTEVVTRTRDRVHFLLPGRVGPAAIALRPLAQPRRRVVGAGGLAEQHDEWTEGRCERGLDVLARRPLPLRGRSGGLVVARSRPVATIGRPSSSPVPALSQL